MATAYHRDQVGAPALTYSTAASNIAHFTALKTVLKACLITGYGSQPAAGWLLINEGTNFIVLRTGTLSGYVCLTWVSAGIVRVHLAETYTGMSGDVMTGAGLKSGVSSTSTSFHAIGLTFAAHSSEFSSWKIVADSRSFCFNFFSDLSLASADTPNSGRVQLLYAGEDSAGWFISVGGIFTASTSSVQSNNFDASQGFTALKNPATGLLVGAGALAVVTPALVNAGSRSSQITPLDQVDLAKITWFGGGVAAGALRGLSLIPALFDTRQGSLAAQCLGFAGVMNTRNSGQPINLADGYTYFMRVAYDQVAPFLLTDNPAFW